MLYLHRVIAVRASTIYFPSTGTAAGTEGLVSRRSASVWHWQNYFQFSNELGRIVVRSWLWAAQMFAECIQSASAVMRFVQWLKWFREAEGPHLTKPGWSEPHTHSNPTNLALFRHKITLYVFNQGGSYYCSGAQMGAGGWAPWPPHFSHCQ